MFYEIYVDGKPTGMGSTDKNMAQDMCRDYEMIYHVKAELKEQNHE